jgi:hypothetical protein
VEKEQLHFCKFNPYSEVYEDLEIQQMFIVDKILAMKAFNEFVFLVDFFSGIRGVFVEVLKGQRPEFLVELNFDFA